MMTRKRFLKGVGVDTVAMAGGMLLGCGGDEAHMKSWARVQGEPENSAGDEVSAMGPA